MLTEECDEGESNGTSASLCTVKCTWAKCGDGIVQENGADGINTLDPYDMGSDDEECDDGDGNLLGPPADLTKTWCSTSCKRPECSNGRPQKSIAQGGTEDIEDALADAADGGCYEKVCNFDSQPLPGKDSEDNPCLVQRPGGAPSSAAATKSLGESCTDSTECRGYVAGSQGEILCIGKNANDGKCTDVGGDSGLVMREGLVEVANAAGGIQFPICIPGVCGFVVGDEAACGGAFQDQGQTCDAQRARQQCLFNTAVAGNQCPGGMLVPVPAGGQASCMQGDQKMCGPTGQWFCKCPGDNPAIWQEQLQQCGPKCGDKIRDAGEACDDGNVVDGDGCSATCTVEPGQECNIPNACANNGAPVCGQNETCQLMNQLPCIQCAPQVGGVCTGNECANGGDAAAAAQGMECSLIPEFPCITMIPPNSCGNGDIDVVPPQEVDEGCMVTGTSGQFCAPEDAVIDDFGRFHPSHQCYMSADCVNSNGQCGWEMTPELEQCLQENDAQNAHLPEGCTCNGEQLNPGCPVDFVRNPCENLPGAEFDGGRWVFAGVPDAGSLLAAQVAPAAGRCEDGSFGRACTRDAAPCCDDDGNTVDMVGRDGCTSVASGNCGWHACEEGSIENCANRPPRCVPGGCFGELCVQEFNSPPFQCNIVQDAACYEGENCRWTGTACAWEDTETLRECLADNAGGTCPTGQSCLSACGEGQSAGVSCGENDANVCCTTVDQPVEECDDGNRVDGDACGNDCRINCSAHSDCPEGACVEGQCVDQCVAPDDGDDDGGDDGDNNGEEVIGQCPASFPLCGTANGDGGAPAATCPDGTFLVWLQDGVTCNQGQGDGRCYGCMQADQAMHPAAESGVWSQVMALADTFNLLP